MKPNPSNPSLGSASALSRLGRKISSYLEAGYPGLYLVSPEEQRVDAELKSVMDHLNRKSDGPGHYQLCFWSVVEGLVNTNTHQVYPVNDPLDALQNIGEQKDRTITLLKDYHLFLEEPNPVLLRKLKDVLLEAKTRQKPIIMAGCRLVLPPELERELVVVELGLPGRDELRVVLEGIRESAGLQAMEAEEDDRILDAAGGLTTMEAENAFALSFVETRSLEPSVVAREKALAVKKHGILELVETRDSLETIGGLDSLKEWLMARKGAYSQKARDYGLPTPKGVLIVGIPGTGKSLTAKATARAFGAPLLKLDAGRIFAGIVGQSESNLRSAIQTAEAIAPCVLWIDEIEKALSGSKSSGSTDGGTSARVFGSFLSWMQEKTSPVFVVATANDVSQLPPELLRKGRWDELWWVDLPNLAEREAIWGIQIARCGRNPQEFDLVQLAKATEGLTGSEIEAVFVEAMYQAFEEEQEPNDLSIARVLTDFVPLSRLMAEQMAALKNWAKGRARPATTQQPERKLRKIAA